MCLKMALHLANQLASSWTLVIAGACVVDVAKNAFNRVGLRAVGRQPQQVKTRMGLQPLPNRLGFVKTIVVHYHIEACRPRRRVGVIQEGAKLSTPLMMLAMPQASVPLTGEGMESPGQIVLFMWSRRHHLVSGAGIHWGPTVGSRCMSSSSAKTKPSRLDRRSYWHRRRAKRERRLGSRSLATS
jgi:hypothetical protein